jgi:hypothetical protein
MTEIYMVKSDMEPIELCHDLEKALILAKEQPKGYVLKYDNAEDARIAMKIHEIIGEFTSPNRYALLKEIYD